MINTKTRINSLIPALKRVCPIAERMRASLGKLILASIEVDAVTTLSGAFRLSTNICQSTVPNKTKTG